MYAEEDLRLQRLVELFSEIEDACVPRNNSFISQYECNSSKFYDVGKVFSYPEGGEAIIDFLKDFVKDFEKDSELSLAGGGYGGGTIAKTLGYVIHRPSITVFREEKPGEDYIKGYFVPGREYLFIEECLHTGLPTLKRIEIVRQRGGVVNRAVAILSKSSIGKNLLENNGVRVHSLLDIQDFPETFEE